MLVLCLSQGTSSQRVKAREIVNCPGQLCVPFVVVSFPITPCERVNKGLDLGQKRND